ncbi:MAG: hypothetical protein ACKONH_09620, partial [Planctomycetia bacterium]
MTNLLTLGGGYYSRTFSGLRGKNYGKVYNDELVLVAGGGKGPDGGPAVGAAMGQPFGCAIDAAGNLFIADYS